MIKRILIPLDPSPYTEAAMDVGCYLAKTHDAELTGLVVLDTPGIISATGPSGIGGSYYAQELEHHREEEAKQRIEELLNVFKERCEKCGIAHYEAEFQGNPSEEIVNQSIFYDAVLLGMKTYFHFETSDKPGDTLSKVLDHTVTPVYAIPKDVYIPHLENKPMRVVIAFDGSLLAARALQHFAQLSMYKKYEIVLITSNKDKETARHHLGQANSLLHSHGLTDVKVVRTDENIIKVIDRDYLEWADAFVVGAHAKKGLIDFMVGSLTKHLIKINKKPVLIG